MSNPLATMPYGTFSNAIQVSNVGNKFLGFYNYIGYFAWRVFKTSSLAFDEKSPENLQLITAGATITLAAKFFQSFETPYEKIAKQIAIGFYAMEALEHLYRTWGNLTKLVEAFCENQGSYVVPINSPPSWSLYLVDHETGQWLLTTFHLTTIKVQRIAGALLVVAIDIVQIPYYMRRVEEACNPTDLEKDASKVLTLLHAKLLAEKIRVYQEIARKNSKSFENLINTIIGSTTETINYKLISDASKVVSDNLKNDNIIAQTAYNIASDLLYCLFDTRILAKSNTEKSLSPPPKKEQNTPTSIAKRSITPSESGVSVINPVRKKLLLQFDEVKTN